MKNIIDITYITEKNRVADLLKILEKKESGHRCSV
ncbi:arsenical resistance operon repressor [Proteus mirabilis BB2000]|nr:arsenical resistance operon repressor [Proteus mirabilis BB2000]